ncbi:hypothetical protein Tco_1012006 [Tanacetum coccineum]
MPSWGNENWRGKKDGLTSKAEVFGGMGDPIGKKLGREDAGDSGLVGLWSSYWVDWSIPISILDQWDGQYTGSIFMAWGP